MEETATAVPRFIFIHRILIKDIHPNDVKSYLDNTKEIMTCSNRMPAIEYFIPVRTGQDYELTILDLSNMAIIKG